MHRNIRKIQLLFHLILLSTIANAQTIINTENMMSEIDQSFSYNMNFQGNLNIGNIDLIQFSSAHQVSKPVNHEGELNGIAEGDLVLELQADDDSWTSYNGTVNETNNTVSYTFNDAVSFKAVTASAAGATLTIEGISPAASSIYVYPNPTANRVYIQAENITKAELFDLMGRKVKATNQDQIDLSNISSGSYILQVTTQNNTTETFKIIKQ
jgi:hypothetical protein